MPLSLGQIADLLRPVVNEQKDKQAREEESKGTENPESSSQEQKEGT